MDAQVLLKEIASKRAVTCILRAKKTKFVSQVLGVLGSNGKQVPLYFFKSGENTRAVMGYKVLRYTLLPRQHLC